MFYSSYNFFLFFSNIDYLIEKNSVWEFGYSYTLDIFKTQKNVRKNILEEEERKIETIRLNEERKKLEKMKPNNREERAKLFAEAASKRMLPKNKKIKKAWVKKVG